MARPSPSDQCSTTIGLSTTTPRGTFTKAPPARNASWSTVNASGDASEHVPSSDASSSASHVAMPHTRTPLASSVGVERVVHHPAVAHDDEPRALAGLGRDRTAAGRGLVARLTHLVGRHRPERDEVELADAAVAPDLLGGGGPLDVGERARPRRRAASTSHSGPGRPRAASGVKCSSIVIGA